jgi:hypothetical protein
MPYQVFAVKAFAQLEQLAEFQVSAQASAHAVARGTTLGWRLRRLTRLRFQPL